MEKLLLSIAIPTFNRANYLDLCLNSIVSQLDSFIKKDTEILICDNASTDNTSTVVSKYQNEFSIKYYRNEENLGPDVNIAKCFEKATSKYVWVFGDDDFVITGKLKLIINLLKNNDIGVAKLEAVSYLNDSKEVKQIDYEGEIAYDMYTDPIKFIEVVHYWVTFISGTIVNKDLLESKGIDYYEFTNTYLVQLNWVVNSIFQGRPNIVVTTPSIACKADNTGGYKIVTVFSENYNYILKKLVSRGCDERIIDITNKKLILNFFPYHLSKVFSGNDAFKKESGFSILFKTFWNYKSFWRRIFPLYLKRFLNNK